MELKKKFAVFVLLLILVALAAGGGTYAFLKNKADKEKKDLQAQIDVLKGESTATETTGTTVTGETSTTDETADWETYTNDTYGFSFKYPTTWTATDNGKGDVSVDKKGVSYLLEGSAISPIVVQYSKDTSGASIDTYLSGGRSSLKKILMPTTETIGGKTAHVLEGIAEPVYHRSRIVFTNGNLISFSSHSKDVEASGSASAVELANIDSVYNNLLSTITFTDLTAAWKTYENSEYKFSFKYPSDWFKTSASGEGLVAVHSSDPEKGAGPLLSTDTKLVASYVKLGSNETLDGLVDNSLSEGGALLEKQSVAINDKKIHVYEYKIDPAIGDKMWLSYVEIGTGEYILLTNYENDDNFSEIVTSFRKL